MIAALLAAAAVLTPGGIADARVGMTEAEVEQALGRPVKLDTFPGSDCATARLPHKAYALFTAGTVRRVTATSRYYRTRAGVRVGDDEAAITDAYPTARRSPHKYVDGSYFKVRKGKRKLVFETEAGRVTTIHGGARPEVDYVEGCA